VCLDVPQAGQQLAQVANAVGGESFQLDVTADDAPARLIDHLVERHGGVDIVVHNAGITRDKTLAGMDDARWDLVLAVNLIAVERINDELLAREALNENGRVVCLSSAIGGIAGNRGQSNYGATKAGIIGHVEVLAATLAKIGATANAVAPGFIETEMTGTMPFGPREVGRRISSLGQGGLPIDVAETIAYLSGPDASWVNGTTLRVCGQNLIGA
jgi:3-oxoacyl-[acyl-carrier protein] reductase